jgi:endonuclease/exonuclease/phosphatase family metal-dependent hydrolase
MSRFLRYTLLLIALLTLLLFVAIHYLSWHPRPQENMAVQCTPGAPELAPGQGLKVMTWNVQFLAGKRYVFWYEQADDRGPDDRPSAEDLAYNLDEVSRVIRAEQPDLVLLQAVDKGARATDYQDQLALLRERLADLYPCATQAYDWKAEFVPNLHILGSVGRTLATLSRYRIDHAERLQLPEREQGNPLTLPFAPQRALLSAYLPVQGGGQLAVLNTRLDDYASGQDTQLRQLQAVTRQLDSLESHGQSWLIGGSLEMLPLGQRQRLAAAEQARYSPESDLHLLWDKYPMVPSNAEASGEDRLLWLTQRPNGQSGDSPDRTVDYLFHSPQISRVEALVRQEDTLDISDHLPVLGSFALPVR